MSRLWVLPLGLAIAVSGATYGLSRWHPAAPGVPKASGSIVLGDGYRGETVFSQQCAPCHGIGGKGGGVGPKLIDDEITIAAVKAQIDAGSGTMPPALVKGRDEQDVLAFVSAIIATPK